PVLLMMALTRTPESTASLLLNLEGVFTIAIAWMVFRENVDSRIAVGAVAILLGAGLLSWQAMSMRSAGAPRRWLPPVSAGRSTAI
ncbi:MAG TPA: EamA family transporter, partial [Stellaceae bacterium]|nr:EamA family transporter [Stellaceae bacterium]